MDAFERVAVYNASYLSESTVQMFVAETPGAAAVVSWGS